MDYQCPTWFSPLHVWEERGILENAQGGEHHYKNYSSSPPILVECSEHQSPRGQTRLAYINIYPIVWCFAENWGIMKLKGLPKARYDKSAADPVTCEVAIDEPKNSVLHSSIYWFLWKSYLLILLFPVYNHSLSLAMNETCDHGHFAFCRGEHLCTWSQ